MRTYELLAILKPTIDTEEVEQILGKVQEAITAFGGKMVNVNDIGRKKLAYETKNFRDGYFSVLTFELPADKVAELKRQIKLNDNIIRTMFVTVENTAAVK
ncbi:30S ribosomal protein S6 [bacterium]|nr:30S ribosomal protein S6 [bacterium]